MARNSRLAAVALLLLARWGTVEAHRFEFTDVTIEVREGSVVADMIVDVDALALGVSAERDNELNVADIRAFEGTKEDLLQHARETLERRVRFRFDGERVPFSVTFPRIDTAELFPSVFGTVVRFEAAIPDNAADLSFRASRAFGPVRLEILETGRVWEEVVVPGGDSVPFVFGESGTSPPSVWKTYLYLGFTHILPFGLDHILFVLGLFLLSKELKPLLLQVTAFTVAHTATLALSIYGIVSLPSQLVETLIALSIVYVAVENLFTTKIHSWRLALVFGFGLLHGLGFAGVLRELGLSQDQFLVSLISFNAGVEIGQLAVVLLAFLIVGWYRNSEHYRKRVVIPVSLLIAAIALYWTVTRALG